MCTAETTRLDEEKRFPELGMALSGAGHNLQTGGVPGRRLAE